MKIQEFVNVGTAATTSALESRLGRTATAKEASDNYKKVKARAIKKAFGQKSSNAFKEEYDSDKYNWGRK